MVKIKTFLTYPQIVAAGGFLERLAEELPTLTRPEALARLRKYVDFPVGDSWFQGYCRSAELPFVVTSNNQHTGRSAEKDQIYALAEGIVELFEHAGIAPPLMVENIIREHTKGRAPSNSPQMRLGEAAD